MNEKKKYTKHEETPEVNRLSEEAATYHVARKRPCQFTVEELKEEIRLSMEDIKAGRVYDFEDVLKEWDTW